MRDATAVAGMAGAMVDNCETVAIGNLAQAINVLGLLNTDYDRVVKTPLYYVLQLCAEALRGNRLDCQVDSPAYASRKLGGIPAQNTVPYLSAWGATEGDQVALFLVQRQYDMPAEVEIEAPGVSFHTAKILSGPSPEAMNTFADPDAVTVGEGPIRDGEGGAMLTLPATSVTAVFGKLED
jgi:alpha-L-arabinofuranosidase